MRVRREWVAGANGCSLGDTRLLTVCSEGSLMIQRAFEESLLPLGAVLGSVLSR